MGTQGTVLEGMGEGIDEKDDGQIVNEMKDVKDEITLENSPDGQIVKETQDTEDIIKPDKFEEDMFIIAREYRGKITLDTFIPQLTSKIKEYFKTTYKDHFKPEDFEIVLSTAYKRIRVQF